MPGLGWRQTSLCFAGGGERAQRRAGASRLLRSILHSVTSSTTLCTYDPVAFAWVLIQHTSSRGNTSVLPLMEEQNTGPSRMLLEERGSSILVINPGAILDLIC